MELIRGDGYCPSFFCGIFFLDVDKIKKRSIIYFIKVKESQSKKINKNTKEIY